MYYNDKMNTNNEYTKSSYGYFKIGYTSTNRRFKKNNTKNNHQILLVNFIFKIYQKHRVYNKIPQNVEKVFKNMSL